jgi:hypothetical protein
MKLNISNEIVDFREYISSDYETYAKFCNKNFGKKNYQLNRSYIEWLYSDTSSSFSIAAHGNSIIGIIHSSKAPITLNNEDKVVTVLHDLMVDNNHRIGVGFHLMYKGLYSDDYIVMPGCVGRLSRAYARLGSKAFNSFWYKKFQIIKGVFTPRKVMNLLRYQSLAERQGLIFGSNKENNKEFLENALNKFTHSESYRNYFKWRFFDKNAPLTFYVADVNRKNSSLFVIGKRGRLPYVRFFYVNSESEVLLSTIMKFIEQVVAKIGVPILLYTSFECPPPASLKYKSFAEIPASYIFSRNKDYNFTTEVPSLCSDLGYDAINPHTNE